MPWHGTISKAVCDTPRNAYDACFPGHAVSGRTLVWLLLRLGTPDTFNTLFRPTRNKERVAALQQACTAHPPWQQQLQQATDRELAVLLAADGKAVQRLLFLASTGRAAVVCAELVQAACWSSDEFEQRSERDDFKAWLGSQL
jgi:hypothetical protein